MGVPDGNTLPTASDIGLTRKDIHEARLIRDAEAAEPGLVRRVLDESQRAMVAADLANLKRGDNQHASIEATSQTVAAQKFVVSENLARRHLDESQRAMVAADLANLKPGRPSETVQICTVPAVSLAEAADQLGVARRMVASAKKVRDAGSPELVAMVEAGEVPVSLGTPTASARSRPRWPSPHGPACSATGS